MPVLGIDVSHHNGEVDWIAVARSDVKFGYAKATDGPSFVDPQFARNWAQMREAGLLRGAYHFARPSEDPDVQALHFASVLGTPSWGELPPSLDLEVDGGRSAREILDWTVAFLQRAEALVGRRFAMYTGGLWRRLLAALASPSFGTRLLWTARYNSVEPVVPAPWSRWDIWQFTDGQSGQVLSVPGVRGHLDCDRFRGDLTELQALADQPMTPAPPVPPPPVPAVPQPAWPGRFFVWPREPAVAGEDVRCWQTQIRDRQISVSVDGIYGPESKRACVAFQRMLGLNPDGIVGRSTWDASFDPAVD
jgi:GH25 family lysozyme M1 (1,4-beta-N-acetylmuramidase)